MTYSELFFILLQFVRAGQRQGAAAVRTQTISSFKFRVLE